MFSHIILKYIRVKVCCWFILALLTNIYCQGSSEDLIFIIQKVINMPPK